MQGGEPVVKGFFKNPDECDTLLCQKCKHLLRDPVQLCCGHTFCKSCADKIMSEDTTPQCPDCREDIMTYQDGEPYFLDRSIQMEIFDIESTFWGAMLQILRRLQDMSVLDKLDTILRDLEVMSNLGCRLSRIHERLLVSWLIAYLTEDGNSRGGFRNLLLDGWWLEFWEIILLAAGDVERNPGPKRMTGKQLVKIDNTALGKDDLFVVYDAVFACRANWQNLCLALWISADDLSTITRKHKGEPDACLREGLTRWLQGDYNTEEHGPPTWRWLVDAVANSSGGDDHTLALDIAKEHKAVRVLSPQTSHHCDGLGRAKQMSSAFSSMYCSIVKLLRVNVNKVKDCLRYLPDPRCFDQLCVPPEVYEDATSTKDLLSRLCPRYVNPRDMFVLEEIVSRVGSQRCKRLLKDYTDEFH